MGTTTKFTFRKHASIGAAAAEEDGAFLPECFVDNGDLGPLADYRDRRRLVLGRTGSGKTALIRKLTEREHCITINPETLSFNYLTNSTVLTFFLEAGVKLDLFFKLLWRHVFAVELLKSKYGLRTESDTQSFFDRLKNMVVRDRHKERAIHYLQQWGEHFWEETEYRIKEITQKIENELKASVAGKVLPAEFSLGAASKLSEEERIEVVQRGATVINTIQMRELTDVLKFLDEDVFSDERHATYLCIDRLDENWVDERLRYLLIRSLIETIRDFLQVRNVKIIAALRTDLIERVFRFTRDPGFQEEKYRSLYLQIHWTPSHMLDLLNKRVNYLVRQTYTKKPVEYKDILPSRIIKVQSTTYLLDRTLMRPRDLIEFFNNCIDQAAGQTTLTRTVILSAEGVYSKNRMRSLQDEWVSDYPHLIEFAAILKQRPKSFRLSAFSKELIEERCLEHAIEHMSTADVLSVQARAVVNGLVSWDSFLCSLFHVLYLTGIVGLKTETFEAYQWAHEGTTTVIADTINLQTGARIHPMFYRVLGVKP
jgi:hypothetical protein